jgi:cobyrinic acid a,c-diamide synthase
MTARGLIVAAPRSGSGKTTLTLALLAALRRREIAVQAAKAGPDYIDPAFHAAATGRASTNLDSWAMKPSLLDALMARSADEAEMLVIEGAMGLFDGIEAAPRRSGSTADLAAHFSLPVLLVVDVSGQSQSAAALVRGFAAHDPEVRIGGVVLNRVGSERHRRLASGSIAVQGIPNFGSIPREESLAQPERHLGLGQACGECQRDARFARLADLAERPLGRDEIIKLATAPSITSRKTAAAMRPPGMRIALAQDDAFTFVYPHLTAGWRREGAEILPFSPLADEPPSETGDVCWLPGGYPELHAGRLAAAHRFRDGLARFAATRKVLGECGGYMVLGESIEDANGVSHAMSGLLGHATSFAQRKLHLGYREMRLLAESPLGPEGSIVRGHEFHYATLTATGNDAPLAELADGQGQSLGTAGGRRGNVTGTFFHAIAAA